MLSPARSAGGLMRSTWGRTGILRLKQEFPATHELCRATQKDLIFPAHGLCSSGSMHADGRFCFLRENRGYGGGTRSGAGRLRFAHPSLVKAHFYVRFVSNMNEFNVNPILEVMMLADFSGIALPGWPKFFDENHKVRISHRHWNSMNFGKCSLDRELVAYLGFAH